jgi:hypothetical protein
MERDQIPGAGDQFGIRRGQTLSQSDEFNDVYLFGH